MIRRKITLILITRGLDLMNTCPRVRLLNRCRVILFLWRRLVGNWVTPKRCRVIVNALRVRGCLNILVVCLTTLGRKVFVLSRLLVVGVVGVNRWVLRVDRIGCRLKRPLLVARILTRDVFDSLDLLLILFVIVKLGLRCGLKVIIRRGISSCVRVRREIMHSRFVNRGPRVRWLPTGVWWRFVTILVCLFVMFVCWMI